MFDLGVTTDPMRLHDLVRRAAMAHPKREAVIDGNLRLTYSDLAAGVDARARTFIALGVTPGDRVATLADASADAWIDFLATASVGAIWLGLNPRYADAELRRAIADSEPALLVGVDAERLGHDLDGTHAKVITRSALLAHPVHSASIESLKSRQDVVRASDPCLLVYTSGSTGTPKGALLHHHGICAFAARQNAMWPTSVARIVNFLPINHIGHIVDISASTLEAMGTLIFMNQFDPAAALKLMERERATIWGSVPTVFGMQLALPDFDSYDLSSLELIVWGGACMPRDWLVRLRAICPRLATNYGMTETSSAITSLVPTDDIDQLAGTVGRAFPGVEIKLVTSEGAIAASDSPGEVLARSDLNFLGYWRQPKATADAFDEAGFFRTGDLAIKRPDGCYTLVGRSKEMFKSGGYNVYPMEVEAVIERHPLVDAAVVVGVDDPVWQEVGVAYVSGKDGLDVDDLAAWCRRSLANYKRPKRFVVRRDLPLLPIGKVDRAALKREAAGDA